MKILLQSIIEQVGKKFFFGKGKRKVRIRSRFNLKFLSEFIRKGENELRFPPYPAKIIKK